MMALLMFGLLILLIVSNMPVAFAMGMATIVPLWALSEVPLIVIPQRIIVSLDSYPMLAIPLFVFAGFLMETGGISEKIIRLGSAIVGFIRGGLAMVVILATILFSGLSGSSVADTAAIGSVMIPSMTRRRYPKAFATAVVAAAGGMGILIPPCITMIIYGMVANTSVGQLFVAGFLPGFLMGVGLIVLTYIVARKRGLPVENVFSMRELIDATKSAFLPLLMPIIIMGGILSGVFTATESAAVAVIYGLILTVIYREIGLRELPGILVNASVTTGIVALLIAMSTAFSWAIAYERIPHMIATFIGDTAGSKIAFLLLINILFLITGSFMDGAAAIILLVPILAPIGESLGIHPVHLGIILVANIGIGMITPPVGICLFTACGISGVGITRVFKPLLPFIVMMISMLLLITYWPAFTLFLPRLFFNI